VSLTLSLHNISILPGEEGPSYFLLLALVIAAIRPFVSMLPKLSSVWSAALAVLAAASSVALAQQHIPVTGAPAPGNGPVPPRLNINDMQANGGPAW